jgi:hypothetical protein
MLRNSITVVWFVLIAATMVSWYLGTDHALDDATLAGSLILLVAFIKIRFVGLYFMELRHAPIPLRIVFECWCLAVCAGVVGMFVFL